MPTPIAVRLSARVDPLPPSDVASVAHADTSETTTATINRAFPAPDIIGVIVYRLETLRLEGPARTAARGDFFGDEPRLLGKAPAPRIALAQQSLLLTRTRRAPIADATDNERLALAALLAKKLDVRAMMREYLQSRKDGKKAPVLHYRKPR